MTTFWWISGAMVALGLAIILPSLRTRSDSDKRGNLAVAVYERKREELRLDAEAGILSQADYACAQQELQQALLTDASTGAPTQPRSARWATPLTAFLVPALAVPLYLHFGNTHALAPDGQPRPIPAAPPPGTAAAPSAAGPIDVLAERLAARLAADPKDASGWALLGRSYEHLGRYDEARTAYRRAAEYGADSSGDQQRVDGLTGQSASLVAPVQGVVSLDPAITDLTGDETVFVFAREINGPRAPVAVLRTRVRNLPLVFELDDSMSMQPSRKLTDLNEAVVTARVSRSGAAAIGEGDFMSAPRTVKINGKIPIHLLIDRPAS